MSEVITLLLLYAPVKRIERSRTYQRNCYEVGILEQGHTFLSHSISNNTDCHQLISSTLQDHQLSALSIHPLNTTSIISTEDHQEENTAISSSNHDTIGIFHVVPTVDTREGSEQNGRVKFVNMSTLMQSPKKFLHSNWELLLMLDQWLHNQHTLPTANPDLLFTPDLSGHGLVGTIQDIIENPLHREPPEDSLVVGINNPVFIPIESTELGSLY